MWRQPLSKLWPLSQRVFGPALLLRDHGALLCRYDQLLKNQPISLIIILSLKCVTCMFQKERLKVTKRYGFFNISCIFNFCPVKIRYSSGSHSILYLEYAYFNFKQLNKKSHYGVVWIWQLTFRDFSSDCLVPMIYIYISDHQIPHHLVKVPVVIVRRHTAKSIPVDCTVQHATALA